MQDYASHRRWNPLVHFFCSPVATVCLILALQQLGRTRSLVAVWMVLASAVLIVLNLAARGQALRVQDRVIRLEMRLRLADVLPPALRERANALELRHLLALRFASDAELPALVERVLAGELSAPNDIKRAIRDWQADELRA